MMAGDPNWWSININGMHPQLVYGSSSPLSSSNPSPADDHHLHPNGQDFPIRSWSQLLLGTGLGNNEEERFDANLFHYDNEFIQANTPNSNCWPSHHHQVMPLSSPTSCITTLSNNYILNFKSKNKKHNQDHSSDQCNSTDTGGASKKARVTQSSAQPALKVRKEKLGDRITALHQLVSPFGKTDTASVLSEAIGYIRFLQGQIEALSSPYMRNASRTTRHHQHSDSQGRSGVKDLRSRGLCLVPISCTQHVGNENGADYWAPAALDGGFLFSD